MRNSGKPKNPYEGFKDASPRGGNYDWINDQTLYKTLATHDKLWRRIAERFPRAEETKILICGYGSIPMGIELSQRSYRIIYIAYNEAEKKRVLLDCEAQAGNFESILVHNWWTGIPNADVLLFTGLLGILRKKSEIRTWLHECLRRVPVIVCAEQSKKENWKRLLEKNFSVHGFEYNEGKYTLLEIERR